MNERDPRFNCFTSIPQVALNYLDELTSRPARLRGHHYLSANQLPDSIAFPGRTVDLTSARARIVLVLVPVRQFLKLGYRKHHCTTNEKVDFSYADFCITVRC